MTFLIFPLINFSYTNKPSKPTGGDDLLEDQPPNQTHSLTHTHAFTIIITTTTIRMRACTPSINREALLATTSVLFGDEKPDGTTEDVRRITHENCDVTVKGAIAPNVFPVVDAPPQALPRGEEGGVQDVREHFTELVALVKAGDSAGIRALAACLAPP